MQRFLAIAIHDVSPVTQSSCERLIALVQRVCPGAPLTLLIVPDYHGRARIDLSGAWREWVDQRIAAGDELALHGFWHRDLGPPPRDPSDWVRRRLLTDNEAEFAALEEHDARERLRAGLELFEKCGWSTPGFIPPAWQISRPASRVLHEFKFRYTATRTHIELVERGERLRAPALSLSARSAVRRRLSRMWARRWVTVHDTCAMTRLALHPADAQHADLMKLWSELIARMADGRVPITKGGWAEREIVSRNVSNATVSACKSAR